MMELCKADVEAIQRMKECLATGEPLCGYKAGTYQRGVRTKAETGEGRERVTGCEGNTAHRIHIVASRG
jgi:hypothetical protein